MEIKLTSSAIAAETMTRAPYEGTIGSKRLADSQSAGVRNERQLYDDLCQYKMTFTDNGTDGGGFPTRLKYYPADNPRLCISAACIRLRIGALRPMTNAKFTFNGSQDVMAAGQKIFHKEYVERRHLSPHVQPPAYSW